MEHVKTSFLQAVINHGAISFGTATNILEPLCRAFDIPQISNIASIFELMDSIDKDIRDYGHVLTHIKHPIVNTSYIVFAPKNVNNAAAELEQALTAEEMNYFTVLLEKLLRESNYSVPWHAVYIESNGKLTKKRMQELVNEWTQQGYLLSHNDDVYIGPRTMVQFAEYIRQNHTENVDECELCKNILFWGPQCPSCQTEFHHHCLVKYQLILKKCPTCKADWNMHGNAET